VGVGRVWSFIGVGCSGGFGDPICMRRDLWVLLELGRWGGFGVLIGGFRGVGVLRCMGKIWDIYQDGHLAVNFELSSAWGFDFEFPSGWGLLGDFHLDRV